MFNAERNLMFDAKCALMQLIAARPWRLHKLLWDELIRLPGNCCYIISGIWVIRLLAWQ